MAKKSKDVFADMIKGVAKEQVKSDKDVKQNIQKIPELEEFIIPLSEEEFTNLESNILTEGCRDALVVWQNGKEYILVDGHNRHKICTKHGLDFQIKIRDFEDIDDVKDWMIDNQLGRRNLSPEQLSYYRGMRYNRTKKKIGGTGANQYKGKVELGQNVPTAQLLAEQYKVSDKTIKRDEKFALALDTLTDKDRSLKRDILTRKIEVSKSILVKLFEELPKRDFQKIAKHLTKGTLFKNASQAVLGNRKEAKKDAKVIDTISKEIIENIKSGVKSNNIKLINLAEQKINELKKLMK